MLGMGTFFLAMLIKPFVAVALLLPGAFAAAWIARNMKDGRLKRILLRRIN